MAEPSTPLSAPLRALLPAYAEALSVAAALPLFVRRWFRPFVRLILVNHVARRVGALKRRANEQAALADRPEEWAPDIERLERFERSLPPTRTRTWLLALVTLSLVAAWVLALTAFHAEKESADVIEQLTRATVTVSPEKVIDTFDPPEEEPPAPHVLLQAGLIALYAGVVGLLLPSSSYRLKHVLVTSAPRTREKLEKSGVRNAPDPESIVVLERSAFRAAGGRRPTERSLDLVAQTLLAVPPLLFGAAGLRFSVTDDAVTLILAVPFLVVGALALAGVSIMWRARRDLKGAVPQGFWRRPIVFVMEAGLWGPLLVNAFLVALLVG